MMTALHALPFCRVGPILFISKRFAMYLHYCIFLFSAANILYMASQEMMKVVERDSTTIKQNLKKVTI